MGTRTRILISVIPAILLPLCAAFFYFVLFPAAQQAWGIYAATKAFILLWPLIALLLIQRRRPTGQPINWAAHVRAIPLGVATGVIIVASGVSVYEFTAVGDYVRTYSGEFRAKVEELNLLTHYVLFTAGISLLHSLLEEYYWRWFVFGQLRRLVPFPTAMIVASLGFMAHHVLVLAMFFGWLNPVTWLFSAAVAIGGAVWCWTLERHGSLWGPWIGHLLVDAAIFATSRLMVPAR